jgi:hypothetical protein
MSDDQEQRPADAKRLQRLRDEILKAAQVPASDEALQRMEEQDKVLRRLFEEQQAFQSQAAELAASAPSPEVEEMMRLMDMEDDLRQQVEAEQERQSRIAALVGMSLPSPPVDRRVAGTFYECLQEHIQEVEDQLGSNEQLEVSGPNSIKVKDFAWHNPDLFVLYGFDGVSLLAHYSAISLMVRVTEVTPPEKPHRIGFRLPPA